MSAAPQYADLRDVAWEPQPELPIPCPWSWWDGTHSGRRGLTTTKCWGTTETTTCQYDITNIVFSKNIGWPVPSPVRFSFLLFVKLNLQTPDPDINFTRPRHYYLLLFKIKLHFPTYSKTRTETFWQFLNQVLLLTRNPNADPATKSSNSRSCGSAPAPYLSYDNIQFGSLHLRFSMILDRNRSIWEQICCLRLDFI